MLCRQGGVFRAGWGRKAAVLLVAAAIVLVVPGSAYSGPDNANAAVAGSCTDLAGNIGTASFALAYDGTPPALSKFAAKVGNRRIDLTWTASADTKSVDVTRAPGASGAATSTIYHG